MVPKHVVRKASNATSLETIRLWIIGKLASMIWQHVEYLAPGESTVANWLAAEDYVNRTFTKPLLEAIQKLLGEHRAVAFSNNWPLIHLFSDDVALLLFLKEKFREGRDLDAYLGGMIWEDHFMTNVIGQLPRPPYGQYKEYIPNKA